jgi:putative membrane protein
MTPSFSPKSRRALLWGALFMAFNGFFVARVPQAMRPELAGVSAAFVLVLWAPSFWVLKVWLGWPRAALSFAVLGSFAVLIETFAVKTGWPYGRFSYGDSIGIKYFGVVPWTVPFAWSPLVLGAWALAARWFSTKPMVGSVLLLLLFDLVLDPGAVEKKMWSYDAGGWYYGVPFSNFCGWIVSGLIGSLLLSRCCGANRSAVPLPLVASATLILAFWTSVCAFSLLWVPTIIGGALLWAIRREIQAST